jgi:hypothetical protein
MVEADQRAHTESFSWDENAQAIKIPHKTILVLMDKFCGPIVECITNMSKKCSFDVIVLIGAASRSEFIRYVYAFVRFTRVCHTAYRSRDVMDRKFSSPTCRVVTPNNCELYVSRGAVDFATHQQAVQSHIARMTIGVGDCQNYDAKRHVSSVVHGTRKWRFVLAERLCCRGCE